MRRITYPQPTERHASEYRRMHANVDFEPASHLERGGFGYREGYRGAYAERPRYRMRRAELNPPEPAGSGWPTELHHAPDWTEEEHLRALSDRDLGRAIDAALYNAIGPEADFIAIYTDDAVVTLAGEVISYTTALDAVEVARRIPGVQLVRDRLRWIRW